MLKRHVRLAHPKERFDAQGRRVRNKILLLIPEEEYAMSRAHWEFINLRRHAILYEPGQLLKYVYFPNIGMISLVVATEDGRSVEVGVVGNEGFTGMSAAIGLKKSLVREVVQISGDGFRIEVDYLQRILKGAPKLQQLLNHYAVVQGMQVAQTAACNRLHKIERRLARWLLMTQDRVTSEYLQITHDFLATMLGTDRPSLSLAAHILQKKKIIEYTRGAVKILNRKKLEASACECYRVIRHFNDQVGST